MVTITLAKSLEIGQIVTTAEADHQRELGNIKSKYAFECIDEKCDAQITCANLLKEVKERKKDPYFIYVGEHSDECKEKEKIEILEREQQERHDSRPRKYVSEKVALFNFDKPSNKKVETTSVGSNASISTRTDQPNATENSKQEGTRPSKKALSTWVELFRRKDSDISVIYNDEEIHIRDLFINIDEVKDLADLEDEPRIYYGTAWVNPNKNGIQFSFRRKKFNELTQNPSLMLYSNKIQNESENGRFSEKTLKKLAARRTINDKPQPITVYIFSQLPPQLSKNGKFINFYAKELTYIYYEK